MAMSKSQVIYCPPDYPEKCFPSRCKHEPQFVMMANVVLPDRKAGRKLMEIDHRVCLACGKAQPCTIGGNVLVDLQMLLNDKAASHPKIGARITMLREKWARIARHLFDENGWNGRHERVARMIDPNLTMKLEIMPGAEIAGRVFGTIKFDPEYLRWADEDNRAAA